MVWRRKVRNQGSFLEMYGKLGEICAAAKAANIDRGCHYDWLETDEEYRERFLVLQGARVQQANDTAYRLGVVGVMVPKTMAGGRELVREFDSKILIRWLEVHDEKWRPRTDVNITNFAKLTKRLNAVRERVAKAREASEPTEK